MRAKTGKPQLFSTAGAEELSAVRGGSDPCQDGSGCQAERNQAGGAEAPAGGHAKDGMDGTSRHSMRRRIVDVRNCRFT